MIVRLFKDAALGQSDPEVGVSQVRATARAHRLDETDVRRAAVDGWRHAAEAALDPGPMTRSEEVSLLAYRTALDIQDAAVDTDHLISRFYHARVLRRILDGEPSLPCDEDKSSGIMVYPVHVRTRKMGCAKTLRDAGPNRPGFFGLSAEQSIHRSERKIWLFSSCSLIENHTHHHHVGGSRGVSIRMAKGVYYHTAHYRRHTVETHSMDQVDHGRLLLTDARMSFAGEERSFSIPYGKIMAVDPYRDGVMVHPDGARTKPHFFRTGDGLYLLNLIENLAWQDR